MEDFCLKCGGRAIGDTELCSAHRVEPPAAVMNPYETGRQPCQSFKAAKDGNEYATWDNVHECYRCKKGGENGGLVSFCETCSRDHHMNGYDTCENQKSQK